MDHIGYSQLSQLVAARSREVIDGDDLGRNMSWRAVLPKGSLDRRHQLVVERRTVRQVREEQDPRVVISCLTDRL
jgi:hypothetical protein